MPTLLPTLLLQPQLLLAPIPKPLSTPWPMPLHLPLPLPLLTPTPTPMLSAITQHRTPPAIAAIAALPWQWAVKGLLNCAP